MTISEIRNHFHTLIDTINDEKTLLQFYEALSFLQNKGKSKLWESLTEEQQQQVLASYEESKNPENEISHSEMKKEHEKWLSK